MKVPTYTVLSTPIDGKRYQLVDDIVYYSDRYAQFITVPAGYLSDGATGALDIHSAGWWIHDKICDDPQFDDGTPITAWQAATILSDILKEEGRILRSWTWRFSTFLFGCHNARSNGYF